MKLETCSGCGGVVGGDVDSEFVCECKKSYRKDYEFNEELNFDHD